MRRGEGILIVAGSTREGSLNRALAKSAAIAAAELRFDATLLDLREYPLPLYERGVELSTGIPRTAMALRAQLKRHPLWLIVSPDHHNSISTLLRNVIDWAACRVGGEQSAICFRNKAVGLLGAADGGGQGLTHLRQILVHLGACVAGEEFVLSGSGAAFDEAGRLRDVHRWAELRGFVQATQALHAANVTDSSTRSLTDSLRTLATRVSLLSPG